MKASVYFNYGNHDVVAIKEVEKPTPKDNEILIKVYATTVNRTDCAILQGNPFIMKLFTGIRKPKKNVLGTDFAGEVIETGFNTSGFKAGDKVFCFDDSGLSSQAEYLVAKENKAIGIIPEGVSFELAAASIEGAHYALNFINKTNLNETHKVLVYGASGAIGSALVQILKYMGAYVTAVCDTKNIEAIKSLQPDKVIDYTKTDFTLSLEKYDFVFDAVGKSTFKECKPLLNAKGVYMSSELGKHSQNLFYSLFTPLLPGKKVKFPFPHSIEKSIELVREMFNSKKYNPLIDRFYSLEQTKEAYKYVLSGEKTGNVVIQIYK